MVTTINIENLKCNGCASTIKKGLLKFDQISDIKVNIPRSAVIIHFEESHNSIPKFKEKLALMGYPEAGNNNTFSVAKSFVSCAIGRVNNI